MEKDFSLQDLVHLTDEGLETVVATCESSCPDADKLGTQSVRTHPSSVAAELKLMGEAVGQLASDTDVQKALAQPWVHLVEQALAPLGFGNTRIVESEVYSFLQEVVRTSRIRATDRISGQPVDICVLLHMTKRVRGYGSLRGSVLVVSEDGSRLLVPAIELFYLDGFGDDEALQEARIRGVFGLVQRVKAHWTHSAALPESGAVAQQLVRIGQALQDALAP